MEIQVHTGGFLVRQLCPIRHAGQQEPIMAAQRKTSLVRAVDISVHGG